MSDLEIPRLEPRDLEEGLRPYFENRSRHLVAVYGTGAEQVLNITGAADTYVVPVRSELELRARLPAIDDDSSRVVFLVPFTHDVPLDLACRFARDGRVIRVGRELRLRTLFGASEIDPDAQKSPLADWLLRPSNTKSYVIGVARLTHERMWAEWLRRDWGVETEGGIALDALIAWGASSNKGKAFVDETAQLPELRAALHDLLGRLLGPAGPVVWRAWENGRGTTVLEYAVLFEALAASSNPAVRMWIKQRLKADLAIADDATLAAVPEALGRAAASALRSVERARDTAAIRAIVRAAEQRVDESEVRDALTSSTRLPCSLAARFDALGAALLAGAKDPSAARVVDAQRLLDAVEGHTMASEGENVRHVERAWMAVRLLAWLVARPDRAIAPGPTPYSAALGLAQWYADEGGFVDWARGAARGTSDSTFGRGIQDVVSAVDAARLELDRSFARSFVGWTVAARPSADVLPIEHAIERVAVRFLDGSPKRRLLILLLDGLAWRQAVELLESLGERAWGQLAWHNKHPIGHARRPAMLAAAPSITKVSRASFFAGAAVLPPDPATAKDKLRFKAHKALGKILGSEWEPTLYMQAETQLPSGSAAEPVFTAIADQERRVVTAILNAFDDANDANPATRHPWTVDTIKSLADLLEKARSARRAVLIASDHGNVAGDLLQSKGSLAGEGGRRWRALASESEPVHPYEVKLEAGRAWAPAGAWGVALMADDTARWSAATVAGEHGGATLSEVVAPCLLVGAEDLEQLDSDDRELAIRPAYVPSWWHLGVSPAVVPAPESEPVSSATIPKKASQRRTSAFARSPLLEGLAQDPSTRKRCIQAVDFLLARGGIATAAAFAAEMNVMHKSVHGLVSKLQEVLNVDGYEVIRYDASSQHVHLDVPVLRLVFEVPA